VHFADRLFQAVKSKQNAVMVGIDPRWELLPETIRKSVPNSIDGITSALTAFGKDVIDVVAPLVPIVKFQAACYELYGLVGCLALWDSATYARQAGMIVVIDGKRNDIGTTAEAYANAYLGTITVGHKPEPTWNADALTVNPYLGSDGILPFVQTAAHNDKGAFALVKTSNPSSGEIQDLVAGDRTVYRHVADLILEWGLPHRGALGYSLLGAVVGATYPRQLAELREAMPGVPFLVPGYGAQGGKARDVAAAFDADGLGAVINNSRGITYAYDRPDLRERFRGSWQGAVEFAVREMIDELAAETPCGKLRAK
jgi:orotidine-5'-phosphate decarboxylase